MKFRAVVKLFLDKFDEVKYGFGGVIVKKHNADVTDRRAQYSAGVRLVKFDGVGRYDGSLDIVRFIYEVRKDRQENKQRHSD